ncbi:MAG: WD40 repeat domain-containing serine/threonine protein kinase [Pirellulaceae bacterium]
MTGTCPSAETLTALMLEQLTGAELLDVDRHLAQCSRCQHSLDERCKRLLPQVKGFESAAISGPRNWNEQLAVRLTEAICETRDLAIPTDDSRDNAMPVIAGHTVIDIVGQGGMGIVYRGVQLDLNREVAIKVIDINCTSDARQLTRRFAHEAEITASLNHPSIVAVHAIGQDSAGRCFYTMRLVRGRELKSILELANLNVDGWNFSRAIGVMIRICQAIAFAHASGVVHRDLKPSNVMVGDLGEVYVLDWGLAKAVGREEVRDIRLQMDSDNGSDNGTDTLRVSADSDETVATTPRPLLTIDGAVVGTPNYMPPEQAMGKLNEVDERSDVYSLGAMLYQMLAGVAPYRDAHESYSPAETLRGVIAGPPRPIDQLAATSPPELIAICQKAMARHRDDRYESALELAEDLEAFLDRRVVKAYQRGAFAEAKKWVIRNRGVALAGCLALLAVIGGLSFNAWQEHQSNQHLLVAKQNVTNALNEQQRIGGELERTNQRLGAINQQLAVANREATAAKESEQRAKLEAYELLAESYANFGEQEAAQQHFARAALWFTKAAELSAQSPDVQQTHSMRAMQFGRAAPTPVTAWWDRQDFDERGWLQWPATTQFLFDPSDRYLLLKGRPGTTIIDTHNGDQQFWGASWFEVGAFSPDGQHVALSTKKGRVCIYRLNDGVESQTLLPEQHRRPVHALEFSHNGRLLFVGTVPAQIWDVEQSQFQKGTYPIGNHLIDVGFSRDDRQFLSESQHQLTVFDIVDEDGSHQPHSVSQKADHTKPDAQELAVQNKELRARFRLRQVITNRLATTAPDGTNVRTEFLDQFGGHGDVSVSCSAFDFTGRHLAIAHGQGIVRLWQTPPRPYWFLRTQGLARPVFSPDSSLVAAVGHLALSDDEVPAAQRKPELLSTQAFDPATGQALGPEISVGAPILDGCFSPDGRVIALACAVPERSKKTVMLADGKGGFVQIYDWKSGERLGDPIAMPSEPHVIAWHPTNDQLAVACAAGEVLKIDVNSHQVTTLFEGKCEHHTWRMHRGEWDGCSMSFAFNGELLLWCFCGQSHVLDFNRGSIRYSPPRWSSYTAALTSRNDVFLNSFVNHHPRALRFIQQKGWKWIKTEDDSGILPVGIGSVAKLSRDGRYVVSNGVAAHATRVWDLEQRRIACPPFGEGARDVDFIYGTPYVITAVEGRPCSVHFWDRLRGCIASPTLEIPGSHSLTWIRVAESGHFAAMTCDPHGILVCDLRSFHDKPQQGISPEDARMLAEVNSGAWIEAGRITKLSDEKDWINRWDDFRNRHPDYHRREIPIELAVRDHQTRAAEFEFLKDTTAAEFHRRMAEQLLAKKRAAHR